MSRTLVVGTLLPAFIFASLPSVADDSTIEKIQITANRNLVQSQTSVAEQNTVDINTLNFPLQKISDALLFTPGVSLNGQGGLWQSYNIRGLARWRVKSLIDGININTDRRAGNSLSFIDPNLLSSVDVITGPSSVYYGSGAIGGVINTNLKQSADTTITAGYNSFADERSLGITTAIEDSLFTGIAHRKAGNGQNQQHQPMLSQFEQTSAYMTQHTNIFDELDLNTTLIGSYGNNIGKTNNQYPTSRVSIYPFEKHILGKITLSKAQKWALGSYFHDQKWQADTLRINKRRNVTSYQSFDWGVYGQQQWSISSVKGRYGFDVDNRSNVEVSEQQFATTNELQWSRQILAGDEYRGALYADASFSMVNAELTIGARAEHLQQLNLDDKTTDNFITGFTKLTLPIDEYSSVLVDLGTGFRFPTLTERFFNGTTARAVVVGNIDLKPEQSKNVLVSYSLDVEAFKLTINGFYNRIENYIERVEIANDRLTYRNETTGVIYGGEIELQGELSDNLSVNWMYQVAQGENEQGEPLADIAPDESRLVVQWLDDDWSLSAQYRYRRHFNQPASGEQQLAASHIVNISGRYWVSEDVHLSLSLNNVTDESYFSTTDDASTIMPGRHIGLAIEWTL